MKQKIFVSLILLIAFASKVLPQAHSYTVCSPVYPDSEMKKFYIYKTPEDFLNGKKTSFGNFVKRSGNGNYKFTLDSAGKKIMINVEKMPFFAYEFQCMKYVFPPCPDCGYGPFVYVGGNKYTYALKLNVTICSDDNGWIKSGYNTYGLFNMWGGAIFFKVDESGKPVGVIPPKREKNYKYENILDLETLAMEYPSLHAQYLKEVKQADKSNDPSYLFWWEMVYFKKYADMLDADKKNKQQK